VLGSRCFINRRPNCPDSERHGGRLALALFGREINLAESPLALVAPMREVANGTIKPDAAVCAYHLTLQSEGIHPARSLEDDLHITEAPLTIAPSSELVHH
jgi:hypothetical protein